jgi:dolichol-phosphate mannosyltransferase
MVRGEWTVIMDCDLQDAPEEIPRLLAVAEKGFDVVLARRAVRKDKLHKRILARLFYSFFNFLSGYRMDPSVGSFRILHRRVVDAYKSMHEAARLFGGMIEWLGFETTCVDVEHGERYEGSSTYDLRAMMRLALDGMIAFSNRPLYLSVGAGALMAIASAAVGLCWLIMYFTLPVFGIPGWLSTVMLTTFIGGLMLINLGIVGLYVGRIYDQTKGRPLYVVDRVVMHAGRGQAAPGEPGARD